MSPLELRSSLCVIVVDMASISHLVLRPPSLLMEVGARLAINAGWALTTDLSVLRGAQDDELHLHDEAQGLGV